MFFLVFRLQNAKLLARNDVSRERTRAATLVQDSQMLEKQALENLVVVLHVYYYATLGQFPLK